MIDREQIIRMAREADREWDCDRDMVEWLEWFAALVAAASASVEREACIRIMFDYCYSNFECEQAAELIRARGKV